MTKELNVLPRDAARAALLGRVWLPGVGPAVIAVRQGKAIDISDRFPLSALLLNEAEPAKALAAAAAKGRDLGPIAAIIDKFRHLKASLIFILAFVGVKMLASHWVQVSTTQSLVVISLILCVGLIPSAFSKVRGSG